MGRKKKKGADSRGYSVGAASTTASSRQQSSKTKVQVTTSTHDGLVDLLGQLQQTTQKQQTHTLEPTSTRSDRFVKRLTNVVDRLLAVGFSMQDIEQVCVALGYGVTLETALDWFCLHFSADQLPTILTEVQVRNDDSSSMSPFEVILAATAAGRDLDDKAVQEDAMLTPDEVLNKKTSRQEEAEDMGMSSSEKARLLAQYEYEEEEDEHDAGESDGNSAGEQQQHPQVLQLKAMQKELEEIERDLADEASNYMRSKHEIKEMRKRAKQQRQIVNGLQKQVDRLRAKEEASVVNTANEEASEDEEELGVDLFSMAADEDEQGEGAAASNLPVTSEAVEQEQNSSDSIKIPDDAIPKSWTGKTPKKFLEEICRKNKIPKPRYEKLAANGCRIVIKSSPNITLETAGTYSKYDLVQEYMVTRALYEMSPDLPLYRLFPPFFRDAWKGWLDQKQHARDAADQADQRGKQEKIDRLLELIEQKSPEVSSIVDTMVLDEDNQLENSPEMSNRYYDSSRATKSKANGKVGEVLRKKFMHTQETDEYQKMLAERQALPINGYRDQILQSIQSHPVVVLVAETGAGKTTQCPQFILEDALLNGKGDRVSILCTQPRRVAATSVAERVSEEMAEPEVGQTVGYHIRLETKRSPQTKLLFCTTGVVLRRLQEDPTLSDCTHVVVDEVHERQYQIDVLLIALRQLISSSRPDLKIILMSATLDADLFCAFFNGAPLVSVPGRTYPVSSYYLEDLLDATDHIIEEGSQYAIREHRRTNTASLWVTGRGGEKHKQTVALESEAGVGDVSDDFSGYKMSTRRSMDRVDEERINYDLIEDVLRLLLVHNETNDILLAPEGADLSSGSILIFLPGIGEIRSLSERLEGSRDLGDKNRFDVIPLHSSLSAKDQRRAFAKPRRGCRKIIISTNIAETSVTIPDVVCVIDSGRVREVRQNKRTSTSTLVVDWCSRASAKQRAGRAGRVQPGLCLKLFSSRTHHSVMKDASEPELRRVPLEEVCLGILAGGFASNCMSFLRQAPQPPTEDAVKSALQVLEEVGAVRMTETDSSTRETLTPLGIHLSKLPIHVRLGKMLIFGALFRCVDPILTIAAALSCQSPFASFWGEANEARAKHRAFADDKSDFLTLCNVWKSYCKAVSDGQARKFISANFLSRSALAEIRDMREHFVDLLCDIGFLQRNQLRRNRNWYDEMIGNAVDQNSQSFPVVHAVICAGLFGNVAHLIGSPSHGRSLTHNGETLHFHSSSVNSKLATTHGPSMWITFFEKFETNRVFISTTSPIHPFSMLLFGGHIEVRHLQRLVVVDDWIELGMAAQTGVMFRELRRQVSELLEDMIANKHYRKHHRDDGDPSQVIDGIVKLLTSSPGNY